MLREEREVIRLLELLTLGSLILPTSNWPFAVMLEVLALLVRAQILLALRGLRVS